jgi:hypothetical protein
MFRSSFSRQSILVILVIAIISLVIAGLGLISVQYSGYAQNTSSSSSATPATTATTLDRIQCNVSEHFVFHIHTHVDIFFNGKHVSIPPQIGIIPGKCIYWMHTHDGSGIIHIESPIKRDFTLGQFFDLLKMKVSNPKVFDNTFNGKDNVPSVSINGSKVPSTTNYRDIKLSPHQEIVLVYGTPLPDNNNVPSTYNFPIGL